ncbi:hypothetical protein NDU88_004569 [Pleurodeles waltl]|uniref:Uncharacterized protein n=1 Tax=Pleurodeles waltl TaxID=8319 RepID=A0AAV7T959_PLEWA|nr:hypothetical protein NDU88_004569 [Pleurodeles waltl]
MMRSTNQEESRTTPQGQCSCKAQSRGGKKKEQRKQCGTLERDIRALEVHTEEEGGSTPNRQHQICLKCQELWEVADHQARAYALAQRCFYYVGDKTFKLLAWLDKRDSGRSWVREIRVQEGEQWVTNAEIAETFAAYYERIYASGTQETQEGCRAFVRNIDLPQLSETNRAALNVELTAEEIVQALQSLQ